MPTFSLNFSRPGSEVVAQYFMFVASAGTATRDDAASAGGRVYVSSGSPSSAPTAADRRQRAAGVRLRAQPEVTNYTVFDVSDRLRERAGSCRRTRSPRTARTSASCGSWSAPGCTWTWPNCCSTNARHDRGARGADVTAAAPGGVQGERLLALTPVARGERRRGSEGGGASRDQQHGCRPRLTSSAAIVAPAASISSTVEASSTCPRSRMRCARTRRARGGRRSRSRARRPGAPESRSRRRPCRRGSGGRSGPRR